MKHPIDFTDLVTLLIKINKIHQGHWGVYVGFSTTGTNINAGGSPKKVPCILNAITGIGIYEAPEASESTVDAGEVNPAPAIEVVH